MLNVCVRPGGDITRFNILLAPFINKSKNGRLILYSSMKVHLIFLFNCFIRLRLKIMFNNKHTLHYVMMLITQLTKEQ
jgi:hypothetical protein